MPRQKGFATILVVILLTVVILAGGYFIYTNYSHSRTKPASSLSPNQVACTQEAKLCPDGSYVGRSGPKCEFKPCPTSESTSSADISGWKTYTGNDYEFKYPSNGHVVTDKPTEVYISYEDDMKPYFTFTVTITENPNHLNTKQVIDKSVDDLRSNKNAPFAKSQADQTQQTMKVYTNGQITGIKLQSFDEGYPQKFGEVVETTENKIYRFYIGDGSGGGVGDNEEKLLDQILSTFRFD